MKIYPQQNVSNHGDNYQEDLPFYSCKMFSKNLFYQDANTADMNLTEMPFMYKIFLTKLSLMLFKVNVTRTYPLSGYFLGVLTHTTAWD